MEHRKSGSERQLCPQSAPVRSIKPEVNHLANFLVDSLDPKTQLPATPCYLDGEENGSYFPRCNAVTLDGQLLIFSAPQFRVSLAEL